MRLKRSPMVLKCLLMRLNHLLMDQKQLPLHLNHLHQASFHQPMC